MTAPDDHRDAHLLSLRLALGSIVAPKRPPYARSLSASGTSGTATPYHTPSSSSISPTSSPTCAAAALPASAHPHPHAPQRVPSPASSSTTAPPPTPALPVSLSAAADVPPAAVAVGALPSGKHARPGFVGTLQGKSAWDALIHGAWM